MAIALVLCSHTVIYGYAPSLVAAGLRSGAAGVTLFFVLSGYLITRLLIGEEAGTGQVSLPLFYARRALRLFPALWLYLTVISALWLAGLLPHHPWHSFVTSLLYVRNLVGRGHETDHLWSLSLEEQFYLMWPLAVVLLARHRQWRLPLALGIFLLVTAWRLYATAMGLASAGALYIRSDFAFDGPILGCALALAEARWAGHAERWRTGAWPAVAALTASAALALWIGAGSAALVRPALQNTLVAGLGIPLIWSQTGRAAVGWAGWRPLVYLGQISYGVYLWQQLFLGPPTPGFALVRIPPVGLLVTLTVAVSSYVLLETPMLRLKDRWRPRAA
jgi:peptidoglycan/LPS O-acetylase OafA/YrhL